MITALDHIVLVCPDLEAAIADYSALLGYAPAWQAARDGIETALFVVDNTALELVAPQPGSNGADALRAMTADGARLTSLAYRTDDIDACHHQFTRRGLAPGDITRADSADTRTGAVRSWRRFRVPDVKMAGIKSFILERSDSMPKKNDLGAGAVRTLDHIVITTPNPDRAVANYGARFGLRLALDRTAEQWKTRFLFFRLGGLTLEVVTRLGVDHDLSGEDGFGGLTWAVDDIHAAHARLVAAGRTLSEVRTGRKPGTHVFTVRDGTQGVPTLFISHSPR